MADATTPAKKFQVSFSFQDLVIFVLLAVVLYLGYKVEFGGNSPSPTITSVDPKKLAKAEFSNVLEARAQALEASAAALNSGTLDDAQTAGQAAYDKASKQLFLQNVWPSLSLIMPESGKDASAIQKPIIQSTFTQEAKYLRSWK